MASCSSLFLRNRGFNPLTGFMPVRTIFQRDYRDFRDMRRSKFEYYDNRPHQMGWWTDFGPPKSGYPRSDPERQFGVHGNLQDRLDEMYGDRARELQNRVNIGLPRISLKKPSRSTIIEHRQKQRHDSKLEKETRERTIKLDTDQVLKESAENGDLFVDVFNAAELFGIYEDLFPGAIFYPKIDLNVQYEDDEFTTSVYRGNLVKPKESKDCPFVQLRGEHVEKDSKYTLVMVTPDGHFKDPNREYLHWMVGNVKCDEEGFFTYDKKAICDYLQPFPPYSAGFFRYIFVLFVQNKDNIDFTKFQKPPGCVDLDERTFSTSQFYAEFQDRLTPVGLSFFQSDYDSTITDFYHNTLNMEEPRYEYDFLPPYVTSWNRFVPKSRDRGFNLTLDKYRDPKEIQEEVLTKKLKEFHPFKGDLRTEKYPNAHGHPFIGEHPYEGPFRQPSWRQREIEREQLRQGYYKDMDWNKLRYDPNDSHA